MVDWEEPDVRNHKDKAWLPEAQELMTKPRTWGVIATFVPEPGRERQAARRASSLASSAGRGVIVAFRPRGSFEGVSRFKDGVYKVYVRYVGEEEW